jgi:hypothetical protein
MNIEAFIISIFSVYGFASAVEITPFPGRFLKWLKRHKPFSCFLCLAFWFSFFFYYFWFQFLFWSSVFFAFASCGGAVFLKYVELKLLPMGRFDDDSPVITIKGE